MSRPKSSSKLTSGDTRSRGFISLAVKTKSKQVSGSTPSSSLAVASSPSPLKIAKVITSSSSSSSPLFSPSIASSKSPLGRSNLFNTKSSCQNPLVIVTALKGSGDANHVVKQIDIRPIPLRLTHVRGGSLPIRSTYVLERKIQNNKYRSKSPEILRKKIPPLTSPSLVSSQTKGKKSAIYKKPLSFGFPFGPGGRSNSYYGYGYGYGYGNKGKSRIPIIQKERSQNQSQNQNQHQRSCQCLRIGLGNKDSSSLLSVNQNSQDDLKMSNGRNHPGRQAGGENIWTNSGKQKQPSKSKYLMDSRNGSNNLSRQDPLQGRRNMSDKNIYSEPARNLVQFQSNSYKPKLGYRLVDMYDDDPGIMSEAETSSTGFRRGGKARSSLPVVRTPSKTLERPLGLVFLQYRNETKRALLPNEITSMDTVRALFVRSFSKQLTMEYLDALNTKIYIHDGAKDMFYELEDLRDIRDRSVLRLFEPNVNGNGATPTWNDQDQYFSEPEFDSDYPTLHHIHKSKQPQKVIPPQMYASYSLPRPSPRPFSPGPSTGAHLVSAQQQQASRQPLGHLPAQTIGAPPKPLRHSQFNKRPSTPSSPLYSPRSSSTGNTFLGIRTTSDIYSTAADAYVSSPEKLYDNYGLSQNPSNRSGSLTPVLIDEESRIRMEHMERQLANLTGLVQKALNPTTVVQPTRLYNPRLNYRDYIPTRDFRDDIDKHSSSSSASLQDDPIILRPEVQLPQQPQHQHQLQPISAVQTKAQKFGKEKSVSFSDDPPDQLQSSTLHHRNTLSEVKLPSKPAIKSSTLPRVNQQVDRVLSTPSANVAPPPGVSQNQIIAKKSGLQSVPVPTAGAIHFRTDLSPELFNHLRGLQKKAKELKVDVRVLRRHVQAQTHALRDSIRETFLKFKVIATLDEDWLGLKEPRLRREEEMYKMEVNKLDKDITELEKTVEDLRSHVINKRTRVNMADVENMALILSKSSKSVADLKARFPVLHENVGRAVGMEMERLALEDRFLKNEPERLETALKRCKKLTGTLVTLKRLASVQEQRLPVSLDSGLVQQQQQQGHQGDIMDATKNSNRKSFSGQPNSPPFGSPTGGSSSEKNETLDELLDELQFSKVHRLHPPSPPRRLPSYPSTESGGGSPVHPPLPLQNLSQNQLQNNNSSNQIMTSSYPPVPPKPTKIPPPPPPRSSSKFQNSPPMSQDGNAGGGGSMSESSESVNSQDVALSNRHLELLRKQKQLQEQFSRLQNLQQTSSGALNGTSASGPGNTNSLKKTGSESNLRQKLSFAPTGSLGNLGTSTMPNQLYETDIL